jgi:fructose-1,6-bisphosphatase I
MVTENLTTLRTHLEGSKLALEEAPALIDVIDTIALAAKSIAHKVRRARIHDVLGEAGADNVHGETQQKLDVISNELMLHCLRRCPSVGICASEEEEDVVSVRPREAGGRFCVVYDPLDGSSNIDVAASVGTIFSVLPNEAESVLQAGERQLAAGYVVYGSSTLMVLTLGDGVDLFVLDPDLGAFVLVQEKLQIPPSQKIYSINEAYRPRFPGGMHRYLDFAHANGYSSRYIGSMVGDVHRTLLKGGVFLYPAMLKSPAGKLRLLYEGNPMALLIEQAGGAATTGSGRILEVPPGELHQRVPVILGSGQEVQHVLDHLQAHTQL